MIRSSRLWIALLTFMLAAANAQAGIVVPQGLHPGDRYYLAFLTKDLRDATSANIADYNQFAQTEAALNPVLTGTDQGVQWRALASTPTVNAIDNLGLLPGVPIYLLDGARLVAADGPTMFSSATLTNHISLTQFIQLGGSTVWTGTLPGGTSAGFNALGGVHGTPIAGIEDAEPFNPPFTWIDFGHGPNIPATLDFSFYAFSALLVVPEPSTWCLLLIGGGSLFLARYRRRELRRRPG